MTDDRRRQELALIHVAKAQLAIADDSYRAMLKRLCGVESAKDLDGAGRETILAHFKSLGWRYKRAAPRRAGQRPLADGDQARKMRALWLSLYHLGEVREPGEAAIAAFARRVVHREALQFLTPGEANRVIEALKSWCARAGFRLPDAAVAAGMDMARKAAALKPGGVPLAAKAALIQAQWNKLVALGALRAGAFAKLETWLRKNHCVAAPWFLDSADSDRAVEALGRWIRAAKAKPLNAAPVLAASNAGDDGAASA